MQILITHGTLARTRVMQVNRFQVAAVAIVLLIGLMLASGTIYHFVFLKAAREGWPVVSSIIRLVVRDEFAQRDRFLRENLDVMATRVGEMQAKLVKLEAMGDRMSAMVGVKPADLQPMADDPSTRPAKGAAPGSAPATGKPGQGGPYVPPPFAALPPQPSLEQLDAFVSQLDEAADHRGDLFTFIESRLLEQRLRALMVPNSRPVESNVGSGFGFRTDPITGRLALHTGLDFPGETGAPIRAAAGGVVQLVQWHAAYGNMLEIGHGNGLVTRYAHASKIRVQVGDIVKRGQHVADIGSTGRSTGPHLHFEVLVDGSHQDPAKFLAGPAASASPALAAAAAKPVRPTGPGTPGSAASAQR